MFVNGYRLASRFTSPVIVSTRLFNGDVDCGCGAFIILNNEGWVITVAHLFNSFFAFQQHREEIKQYRRKKFKKIRRIKANSKWVTNHSIWWGRDGVRLRDIKILPEGDLAIGRLEPFDSSWFSTFPVFKNPTSNLDIGTSLCKLGYPFYKIEATFDETNDRFNLAPNALPIPRFPIEGIYTRNIIAGRSRDDKYEIKLLETSSPGLRGQSGGPIFDVNGTVWAIQSRTTHFPLGFSPKIKKDNKEVEENQFLNVGLGIHPELIVAFLQNNNVRCNLSN